MELKPVHGGIIESEFHTAQVTFEAPAEGYQNSYVVKMDHDNPAWFDNFQRMFFVKSRNGQIYSKILIDFGINRAPNDPLWFQFKGYANANGSRNWEASVPK